MINVIYILFQISTIIFILLLEQNNTLLFEINSYKPVPFIENNNKLITNNKLRSFNKLRTFNKEVLEELKQTLKNKKIESDLIDDIVEIGRFLKKYKLEKILQTRGLIIDLNSIDMNNIILFKKFFNQLSIIEKICFKNSIILFIIGEKKNYKFFTDLKYFNPINYISPYNYTKTWIFGSPVKMEIGKVGKVAHNISINNMITDISNQYGILMEDLNIISFNHESYYINYNINHLLIS